MSSTPADARKKPRPTGFMRRITDATDRQIDKVIAASAIFPQERYGVDIAAFLRSYYSDVSGEDLRDRKPADLAGMALSHLTFARQRKPGATLVRVFNPNIEKDGWQSRNTIIQIVNDDMPFIVDSVALVLARQKLTMHLTIHPVLQLTRDAKGELTSIEQGKTESFVQMEVDRETDSGILDALMNMIRESMHDVRAATGDWQAMRSKMLQIREEVQHQAIPLKQPVVEESLAMMDWMVANNFTFLGYREYKLQRDDGDDVLRSIPGSGLGILRADRPTIERQPNRGLRRAIQRMASSPDLLVITKANSLSTVHRPTYLDYVGIKTFDSDGQVDGEKRFLGLFTSGAYSRSPRDIPILRHKIEQVAERSRLSQRSHAGKALMHILENFPRDELFQASIDDLARISRGILGLQERQRVKLFVRRDAFQRFVSCLVFVPRDKYNTMVRERIQDLLQNGFGGVSVESSVFMSESNLARLHVIVRTPPDSKPAAEVRTIERRIADVVRTWRDRLRDVMVTRFGDEQGLRLFHRAEESFPVSYQEAISPRAASYDIQSMLDLDEPDDALQISLYRPKNEADNSLELKLFCRNNPIPLSDALPMLENMGLRVISERPHQIDFGDGDIWMQDFTMEFFESIPLEPKKVNAVFQDTFSQVWRGLAENDSFNRLVLLERLTCRQTTLLRTICKYLLQTGIPFSQSYIEEILCRHSAIATQLVRAFEGRFDPHCGARTRQRRALNAAQALDNMLEQVKTQDGDRILRAYLSVIRATLRTNYYQVDADGQPKAYISLKLESNRIPELPLPRPRYEIFVYAPWVEGVHLRAGKIARGGLRWSDRREDFRTEVLGLMKAQTVKNTLIVPTGAKGGFVLKPAPTGAPDEVRQKVVAAYRDFLRGLLDITDNFVGGDIVAPEQVIRLDEDDPYLVVAADKGTATFSDIANELAHEYDFWMGDAFASGGSVGYDHKGMGITAKGAWEAVKRHFREFGHDTQVQPFTVAGIGDMSGDVFGNGMLLSPCIRLQAAFNHLHIFLDPDPDPSASYAERQRLFELPRSGWTDYDTSLISAGGGVYSRQEKSIELSPQVQEMLAISDQRLTPQELIAAILRAPVDLLWNGGIGTYVKASHETNNDVGDRANDAVRVNGNELRAKVVGEGGNLGLTQLGRIEYALTGGRLNTDFIDNSAGVDCSDHEVNIKILLNLAMQHSGLNRTRRNEMLVQMTDEVERLVLRNNYLQTQAISVIESTAVERLNEYAHLLRRLEERDELNREIEFLPDEESIRDRLKSGLGFTRPELSTILSYSKISFNGQLSKSDIATDPHLREELSRYFPSLMREQYEALTGDHRLAKEIITTQITNSIINRMGPAFTNRTMEEAGVDAGTLSRAYAIARECFDMRLVWADIEALDNEIPATAQYAMMNQTSRLLRRVTLWLLNRRPQGLHIADSVARYHPGVTAIGDNLSSLLVNPDLRGFKESYQAYTDIGMPHRLANRMAGLTSLYSALDIIDVAKAADTEAGHVATIYFRLAAGLKLDWLREQIEHLKVDGRWQAMARHTLRENLYELVRTLTAEIIAEYPQKTAGESVSSWLEQHVSRIQRTQSMLVDMKVGGNLDFATLSVAIQEFRKLTHSA
ncbi:MAG: NAD-glutamate dehydrogenase [Gammaproteobacteria bacterium]|nr:NAD-glutamate dehydrogenase [Gammaproteobacteria bacterium]NNF61597.1 NAD-glutamate dehydrogenase [Gammaproteobacteria bacterium]